MRLVCRDQFAPAHLGQRRGIPRLDAVDPEHGRALDALDLPLDDRRHHVQPEMAAEQVGGDFRAIALHLAVHHLVVQRLPGHARRRPARREIATLRLRDADGDVLEVRDRAVAEELLDLGLATAPGVRVAKRRGRVRCGPLSLARARCRLAPGRATASSPVTARPTTPAMCENVRSSCLRAARLPSSTIRAGRGAVPGRSAARCAATTADCALSARDNGRELAGEHGGSPAQ